LVYEGSQYLLHFLLNVVYSQMMKLVTYFAKPKGTLLNILVSDTCDPGYRKRSIAASENAKQTGK
jgi:hypothetical protein